MIKISMIALVVLAPMIASACLFDWGYNGGYSMMGYGGGFGFFMVAGGIIWTIVGILVGVWLWREINKKDSGHH